MSIINDALKKVQQSLDHQKAGQVLANSISGVPPAKEAREKTTWLWVTAGIIFIGFLGCASIFIALISSRNQPKEVVVSPAGTLPPSARANQSILARLFSPIKDSDEIYLNGIISAEDEQLALINNQIFKAGDYVGKKRILSISADKVELFDRGKILVLKTK